MFVKLKSLNDEIANVATGLSYFIPHEPHENGAYLIDVLYTVKLALGLLSTILL